MEDTVSVVCTSFNRFDLLQRCIETFLSTNRYPIEEFIIIEDSGKVEMKSRIESFLNSLPTDIVGQWHLIYNEKNEGLVESVDIAYSRVKSKYIFHTEDDYTFFRSGFIERSIAVMNHDPKIMQVWIRRVTDTVGQPIMPELLKAPPVWNLDRPVEYYLMGEHQEWYGFCFQCGLRHKERIWDSVQPYGSLSPKTDFLSQRECKIGIALWKKGYKAAILPEGYARHMGKFRSTAGNEIP